MASISEIRGVVRETLNQPVQNHDLIMDRSASTSCINIKTSASTCYSSIKHFLHKATTTSKKQLLQFYSAKLKIATMSTNEAGNNTVPYKYSRAFTPAEQEVVDLGYPYVQTNTLGPWVKVEKSDHC